MNSKNNETETNSSQKNITGEISDLKKYFNSLIATLENKSHRHIDVFKYSLGLERSLNRIIHSTLGEIARSEDIRYSEISGANLFKTVLDGKNCLEENLTNTEFSNIISGCFASNVDLEDSDEFMMKEKEVIDMISDSSNIALPRDIGDSDESDLEKYTPGRSSKKKDKNSKKKKSHKKVKNIDESCRHYDTINFDELNESPNIQTVLSTEKSDIRFEDNKIEDSETESESSDSSSSSSSSDDGSERETSALLKEQVATVNSDFSDDSDEVEEINEIDINNYDDD